MKKSLLYGDNLPIMRERIATKRLTSLTSIIDGQNGLA